MFLGIVYSHPRKLNINDDAYNTISLKSIKTNYNFEIAIKQARPFTLNHLLLKQGSASIGDTLFLDLFSGKKYLSIIQSITTDINGTTVLVTKLCDFKFAYCFVSINTKNILITIDIPELNEKYCTRFQGIKNNQYLLQLDLNNLYEYKDGCVGKTENDTIKNSQRPNKFQRKIEVDKELSTLKSSRQKFSANDTAQIDILVVYTPAAKYWAESNEGGIDNTISQAIAKSNLVSENSKLNIKFNLTYSTEIGFKESGNSYLDMKYLTEGSISNVQAIRDAVAADLVILLTNTNDISGVSWHLWDKNGTEGNGYIVANVELASAYTIIHELGHTLGAGHHKEQNYQPGPTEWFDSWPENTWSAGWRWKGDDEKYYCSIMSYKSGIYYADGITHTQVPYFSNPEIIYEGQATGHITEANNASTIQETKHVVASYRTIENKETPTVFTQSVDSINESGVLAGACVIYEGDTPVTESGVVWSKLKEPTLSDSTLVMGSGLGCFQKQIMNLEAGQIYYLRAYATNLAGTSYGNQVGLIFNGGAEFDFITRWQLPEGQDKLEMAIVRDDEVPYYWETIPFEESGTGTFAKGSGLVKIENLPTGKTIRVKLSPSNLKQFNSRSTKDLPANPDRENLLDIEQWGTSRWLSMEAAFYGCTKMNISAIDIPDLFFVTNMSSMFSGCSVFIGSENMNYWPTSTVKNMLLMFSKAVSFNHEIGGWDVSNVANMEWMFSDASSFNQYIGNWDVSNVKSMNHMFSDANSFNQYIGDWNVSNVNDMAGMFGGSTSSIGESTFNQDISGWDVSNVSTMSFMFSGAIYFNQDIGNWDVSNVTNMGWMFNRAKAFNEDLSNWNVSSVNTMDHMFYQTNSFNQNLGSWDVSKVTNMNFMFNGSSIFNQDLGSWNLSQVLNIEGMLSYCNMDINNYSATLVGWSSNSNIPRNLILGAEGLKYKCNAIQARKLLLSEKNWAFIGDQEISDLGQAIYILGDTIVCLGDTSLLYSTNIVDNADSYLWTLPNGQIVVSDTNTLYVNFDTIAVSGNIKVKGFNSCDESNEVILPVNFNFIPGMATEIVGSNTVCQGDRSVLYSTYKIENIDSYIWTLPNYGNAISNDTIITFDINSNIKTGQLKVKGINACGASNEITLQIEVNPIPKTPQIASVNNILTSRMEDGNQWYFQDELIEGATGNLFFAKEKGEYYVVVTQNGCSSKPSNTITVTSTGKENLINGHKVKVYPNPVSGELTVEITDNSEPIKFEVVNAIGQTVHKGKTTSITMIQTAEFLSGIYYLKFENGFNFVFYKISEN